MKTSADYAADVMLGKITLDEVPKSRQRSVEWLMNRIGPDAPIGDPHALLVYFFRQVEALR